MTAIFDDLQKIGLTENQTTVYLALARLGEAKAGEVIKKTGMHRNLVYVALDDLVEKRLVSASRVGRVMSFKFLSPKRLLADITEKERIATNVIEELSQLANKNQQEIVVYEGVDELRKNVRAWYEAMPMNGITRYLGLSPEWHTVIGPNLEKELTRIQNEKKFRIQALAHSATPEFTAYAKNTKGLSVIKAHPLISDNTSETEITGAKIAIRSFIEPYFVVEIEHKGLAKNYQTYFDFLWGKDKTG